MSWRGVVLMPWGGPKVQGVSMSCLGSRCPQGQQCPEGADSRQGTNSLGIPMPLERNNPARGHPGKVSPPPQRSHISANLRAAPAWKIPLFPPSPRWRQRADSCRAPSRSLQRQLLLFESLLTAGSVVSASRRPPNSPPGRDSNHPLLLELPPRHAQDAELTRSARGKANAQSQPKSYPWDLTASRGSRGSEGAPYPWGSHSAG